jgi:hypothetical protein
MANINIKIHIDINKGIKNKEISVPKLTATPFPPLNLRNIGNICPISATKIMIVIYKKDESIYCFAIYIDIHPLKKSKIKVVIPAMYPEVLNTLVAPTFFDPTVRISIL